MIMIDSSSILQAFCEKTHYHQISVREYRRGNQKWTIQRNWQHRVHKTRNNDT